MNKEDEKKLSWKNKLYKIIAKKSWYMPLATAVASLTMLGISTVVAGPAMLTYPMQYVEIAAAVALMAGTGKVCNSRYKEIRSNLAGVESEIEYLKDLKKLEEQKLNDLGKSKSVDLSISNNQAEMKSTLETTRYEAYDRGFESYEKSQQQPKVKKLGQRKQLSIQPIHNCIGFFDIFYAQNVCIDDSLFIEKQWNI